MKLSLLVYLLFTSTIVLAAPIKVFSMIRFDGENQQMAFKDIHSGCVYYGPATANNENKNILGIDFSVKQWRFSVERKVCNNTSENVDLIATPNKSVTTPIIEAGTDFIISDFSNPNS
ncbi:hypothetical protein DQJ85_18705 [Salmonella enterica subsp. enterica serovar Infantis]|nr:hypothetical protein [Salmonella enterica subsp. enterica serovar Infantis]